MMILNKTSEKRIVSYVFLVKTLRPTVKFWFIIRNALTKHCELKKITKSLLCPLKVKMNVIHGSLILHLFQSYIESSSHLYSKVNFSHRNNRLWVSYTTFLNRQLVNQCLLFRSAQIYCHQLFINLLTSIKTYVNVHIYQKMVMFLKTMLPFYFTDICTCISSTIKNPFI